MEAIIKALQDVHDEVVPNYKARLNQTDASLIEAMIASNGGDITMSFTDAVLLRGLLVDMKTAVHMLEQNLRASITNLETTQAMMTPAKRGRPKREEA